ncbi:MAG: FAD-binding protein [Cyanobacteria bacterium SZAS-4]|nr:FAD-binding protein [Cyanobacteria bacterium SZAS-4]
MLIESSIETQLRGIVGDKYVLSSRVDLAVYECDGLTLDVASPDLVVLPKSTEEVAAVMALAFANKIPVSPRGAGTGLSGGATTVMGGISLVLTRMNKILSVDPVDRVAIVQVGATNASVSEAAQKHSLYFAPDPSSQSASTIGGNIAENSGGPHTLKYGMTTNHVMGLKVVLSNGEVITLGGRSRTKEGLDLLGVFIGSEGTIGIATEATLKLIPRAQAVETMLAYFNTMEAAGQAVSDVVASGVVPAAMEMIDQLTINAVEDAYHMGLDREAAALLIIELDGPRTGITIQRRTVESCIGTNKAISVQWANDAYERARIWKARKTAFGALGRIAPHAYLLDGVIPRSKLASTISEIAKISERYNLTIANIYHAGDGNLHPCILYHKDNVDEVKRVLKAGLEILELCVRIGGTLSGEHGIGIEKVSAMTSVFSEESLESMRWIKQSFDPENICNSSKVIPTPSNCGESGARSLLRHGTLSS